MTTTNFHGLRWTTQGLSDGINFNASWCAQAWFAAGEGVADVYAEATAATELEALDALRVALNRRMKRPDSNDVENERGDKILVGGGYRQ